MTIVSDLIDGKTPLEVLKLQLTRIKQLQKAQPDKPVLVKAIEGKCPECGDPVLYQWIDPVCHHDTLTTYGHPIYTRSILWSEIVIDPDTKDWKAMKEEMDKLIDVLKKYDIPYELYYGGNKSCHLNIFLKISDKDREQIRKYSKQYDIDPYKIVRVAIANELLRLSGSDPVRMGLDWGKITFNIDNKGSMVRECGTVRPDGRFKTSIEEIPDSRPADNPPLVSPNGLKQWKFYETPFYKIAVNALKDAVEHAETNKDYNPEHVNFEGSDVLNWPCIKNFAGMRLENNRYYAVEAQALACKDKGIPKEEAKSMLWDLVNTMQGLSESDKELRVDNALELYGTDFRFSCVTVREKFKDYNICDRKNCERHKKIIKSMTVSGSGQSQEPEIEEATEEIKAKAREIAEHGDPLKYIIEEHQTGHIGDISTAQTILLSACCSQVLNSDGIQPKLSGESGKGKTDCARKMLHLSPQEYVKITSASDKALFYSGATLKPGSSIMLDDVILSDDFEKTINRATSAFQEGVEHTTLDINRKLVSHRLPERLVWLVTSVNNDQSLQFLNRTVGGEVDESTEQDERVRDMQLEKAVSGAVGLPITDNVLICREIIREIKKNTYMVRIPFARAILWNDTSNRRNLPIFLDLIKSFAVLRHMQRETDSDGALLASVQDFVDAQILYESFQKIQATKLTQAERNVVCVLMDNKAPMTAREICAILGFGKARLSQILHGKGHNHDSGLFFKVPSLWSEDITEISSERCVRTKQYGLDSAFVLNDKKIDLDTTIYPNLHLFTSSLPYEIKNSSIVFTLFTLKKSIVVEESKEESHSHRGCEDLSETHPSTYTPEKQGKRVNTCQQITKTGVNTECKRLPSSQKIAKSEGKHQKEEEKTEPVRPSGLLQDSVRKYCRDWEPVKKASINSQNYMEVVTDYLKGYKLSEDMRGPVAAAVMIYAKIPQPLEVTP